MLKRMAASVSGWFGRGGDSTAEVVLPTVPELPTIAPPALPTIVAVPADFDTTRVVGGMVGISRPTRAALVSKSLDAAPQLQSGRRRALAPDRAAAEFVAWLADHGLDARAWAVDEVWFLASSDFAPATDVVLPPRNRFLGALQRIDGVRVQYDKRVWVGGRKVKTTVYSFAGSAGREASGMRRAA